MISVITTGRDDGYGVNFLQRLEASIRHNCNLLNKTRVTYDYTISEWNPVKKPLILTPGFNNLFSDFLRLWDLCIDSSVVEAEGLSQKVFFEYFAKNAAARVVGVYPNLLFLNSDILLSDSLCDYIVKLCLSGLDEKKFYRAQFREQYDLDQDVVIERKNLYEPWLPDGHLCAGYSGDFLLIRTDTFINIGQGYDETDPNHRTTYQTGMDGELLWNLWHKGVNLELIPHAYRHIYHGKDGRAYDGYRNGIKYNNKPNWGFVNYPYAFHLNKNLKVIHTPDAEASVNSKYFS